MPRPTKQQVEGELKEYISRHEKAPGQDVYEFNIKVQVIRVPDVVREGATEEQIDEHVKDEMNLAVWGFIRWVERNYPWLEKWGTSGRSGGWLQLTAKDSVFDEEGDVVLSDARRRVTDLDEIIEEGRKRKDALVRRLQSVGGYPSSWGRAKYWEPD